MLSVLLALCAPLACARGEVPRSTPVALPAQPAPTPSAAASAPEPARDSGFNDEVDRIGMEELMPLYERAQELGQQERFDEADKLFLEHLPREQWSAARYLAVGNVFFRGRDDLARELHQAAYERAPKEPLTKLELAYDWHRAGDCARAAPLYEEALADPRAPISANAVLAECLLIAGKPEQATKAWFRAKQNERTQAVEAALRDVHAPAHAMRLRWQIKQRIAAGELALAPQLLELDREVPDKLATDMAWLREQKGIERARLRDLEAYSKLEDTAREPALLSRLGLRPVTRDGFERPELVALREAPAPTRELLMAALLAEFREPTLPSMSSQGLQTLFIALHKVLFGSEPEPERKPGLEVKALHFAGNQLRALIETYASFKPLIGRASKIRDLQGYYVQVDLTQPSTAAERAQVAGPLWTVPDKQSAVGYLADVEFTDADRAARRAHPYWGFAASGDLVRETVRDSGAIAVERVQVEAGRAAWASMGERARMPTQERHKTRAIATTLSGRHILRGDVIPPTLFDAQTGKPKPDDWLESAASDVRKCCGFEELTLFLSDDLEHLLVRREDGNRLAYKRGSVKPIELPPTAVAKPSFRPAERALIVDRDQPLVVVVDGPQLRLDSLDGKVQSQIDASKTALFRYNLVGFDALMFDSSGRRLWLATSVRDEREPAVATITVVVWDLRQSALTERSVRTDQLFRKTANALEPISALAVSGP